MNAFKDRKSLAITIVERKVSFYNYSCLTKRYGKVEVVGMSHIYLRPLVGIGWVTCDKWWVRRWVLRNIWVSGGSIGVYH